MIAEVEAISDRTRQALLAYRDDRRVPKRVRAARSAATIGRLMTAWKVAEPGLTLQALATGPGTA
jgi:hypothetical protein